MTFELCCRPVHGRSSCELAEVFSKAPALLAAVSSQDWPVLASCNTQLRTFIHSSVPAITVDHRTRSHCLKRVWPQLAIIKLKPVSKRDVWDYSLCQLEEQTCQTVVNLMLFKADKRALAQLVQPNTQLPGHETCQHFATGFSFLHVAAWQHLVRLIVEMVDHRQGAQVMLQLGQLDLPCMEDLRLRNNKLDSVAVHHLAKGAWPKLKQLDLGNNFIDETAMKGLIHGKWPSLIGLSLGRNSTLDAAAIALISQAPTGILCVS